MDGCNGRVSWARGAGRRKVWTEMRADREWDGAADDNEMGGWHEKGFALKR